MDYFEKKKKEKRPDFFSDFGDLDKYMQSLMNQLMKGFSAQDDFFKGAGTRPVKMGFSIKFDRNGAPVIREFGNVKRSQGKPVISRKREPLVDVNYLDREIVITAELPGVKKEELDVSAKKGILTIDVKSQDRPYFKEIPISEPFGSKSLSTKLNNGILEITLKKKSGFWKRPKKAEAKRD